MKHIKLMMPVLIMVMAISCSSMNKDDNSNGDNPQKQYATVSEAAIAAKDDMMKAMESVDFGISRDKLNNAEPGEAVLKYDIRWDALLNADSTTQPVSMAAPGAITMIPLVNKGEVITIVTLTNSNGEYGIGAIGDKQISYELDIVRRAEPAAANMPVNIYEVPNLGAIIYKVDGSNIYYTSYNNSIRKGMYAPDLVNMLKASAIDFERRFGDDLRKGDLVK